MKFKITIIIIINLLKLETLCQVFFTAFILITNQNKYYIYTTLLEKYPTLFFLPKPGGFQ